MTSGECGAAESFCAFAGGVRNTGERGFASGACVPPPVGGGYGHPTPPFMSRLSLGVLAGLAYGFRGAADAVIAKGVRTDSRSGRRRGRGDRLGDRTVRPLRRRDEPQGSTSAGDGRSFSRRSARRELPHIGLLSGSDACLEDVKTGLGRRAIDV